MDAVGHRSSLVVQPQTLPPPRHGEHEPLLCDLMPNILESGKDHPSLKSSAQSRFASVVNLLKECRALLIFVCKQIWFCNQKSGIRNSCGKNS